MKWRRTEGRGFEMGTHHFGRDSWRGGRARIADGKLPAGVRVRIEADFYEVAEAEVGADAEVVLRPKKR